MSLQTLATCMPNGDFVIMILYFTVCGSHWLKTPHNSFSIDENKKKEKT